MPTLQAPRGRLFGHALTTVAAMLLVALVLRAAFTFDPYYDSVAYHLPFAARLAGICPDECFRMSAYLESAYDGFPKLYHRLQGVVWRLTGQAQAVDLLNVGALVLFCVFMRRYFTVPVAWTFCALLAVPLVQIHATSAYVDLPVNLAVAAAMLILVTFLRAPERVGWGDIALLLGCMALAANSKPQMIGAVAPVGGLFAVFAFWSLATHRRVGPFPAGRASSWLGLSGLLLVGGAITGATLVANAFAYGNPIYPIGLDILGFAFAGPIDANHIGSDSLADPWRVVPAPMRWVASVLEVGAYSYRSVPWTVDQGHCPDLLAWRECAGMLGYGWEKVYTSFRMGGYFVPYVLALVAFLAWTTSTRQHRNHRLVGGTFVGTTLLAAFLPRSHELRYYLFWMIMLVALCLVTVFERRSAATTGPPGPEGCANASVASECSSASGPARLLGAIVVIALASGLLMTQGRYLDPFGPRLGSVMQTLGIPHLVEQIPDGAVVCADDGGWQPFTFLFAPVFHPGRSYSLRDRPLEAGCDVALPMKEPG
jgi:hypothetical protein